MWILGIRYKKLISIIKEMLKVPIVFPNGSKIIPSQGTPKGGILCSILSNIVLNNLIGGHHFSSNRTRHITNIIREKQETVVMVTAIRIECS